MLNSATKTDDPVLEALESLRHTFMGVIGFSLFTSLLMLTGPLYMLQVYDRVLASGSVPTLVGLTALILVLYVGYGMLEWVRNAILSKAGSRFEDILSDETLLATLQQTLNDPGRSGDKPLRDLRLLRRFISSPAVTALFDAPFSLLFFLILFMINFFYGLLAVIGGVVLVTIAYVNQKVTSKAMREAEQLELSAQQQVREVTQNAEIIEALGMVGPVQERWRDEFDRSDAALIASSSLLGRFVNGTKAFRMLLQSSVLGTGAYLSIIGVSTPGAMIAASIITGRAIGPLEQLVGQWRGIVSARCSWDALSEVLAETKAKLEQMELPKVRGEIKLEGVSAAPPGAKKAVLTGLDLTIEAGDVVGLIGPSAAGKSTLARLLLGIWPAQVGTVRIDGADMASWSRSVIGPQLGYLPQQVDLFSGRVRDNISRFENGANAEGVIIAAQAAGCHDMILRLPDGYDTEIGERGAYLSAGQRQRLGLARALYGGPAIVVMDEPNSNLDNQGERALQDAIKNLKARKATVLIIAHRPSAVTLCNKLLMLEQGQVRAYGPSEEVLAKVAPKQAGDPSGTKSVAAQGAIRIANPTGGVTPLRKGEPKNG